MIRDFTVAQWSNPNCTLQWYDVGTSSDNNMFDTQSTIGTIKGQQPPGYSIIPNLMMYEVAKRDGLSNYQDYFNAAYNNCKWLIDIEELNIESKKSTKDFLDELIKKAANNDKYHVFY